LCSQRRPEGYIVSDSPLRGFQTLGRLEEAVFSFNKPNAFAVLSNPTSGPTRKYLLTEILRRGD
jgi:hypothetical protein